MDLNTQYRAAKTKAQDLKWDASEYEYYGDHKEAERLYDLAGEYFTEAARIKALIDA